GLMLILSTLFMTWSHELVAQPQVLITNRGAEMFLTEGAYMVINDQSLHNQSGIIQNAGHLKIGGDVINDDQLNGHPTVQRGCYNVGGDWINNGSVVSHYDSVLLSGGNQSITGLNATQFH